LWLARVTTEKSALADHVVVNKAQAATLQWNRGLKSNRITEWR
jgi:hypothetical protein